MCNENGDGRILTCVYCVHEFPLRVCSKHPMRQAENDIALLRRALIGLVGVSEKAELEQMDVAMRLVPAPEADKIASLNAIHALLATLPNTDGQPRREEK